MGPSQSLRIFDRREIEVSSTPPDGAIMDEDGNPILDEDSNPIIAVE